MAKFLKSHRITDAIENLIRNADRSLVLISPYWQLSDAIKEELVKRRRAGVEIKTAYRDDQERSADIKWLEQQRISTVAVKNLHAKCYLNESECIITSLNLYARDLIHNREMGILIDRQHDAIAYTDAATESAHILNTTELHEEAGHQIVAEKTPSKSEKMSEAQLAKKLGLNETDLKKRMAAMGYFKRVKNSYELTEKGLAAGGEWQTTANGGRYRIWPADVEP